MLFCIPSDKIRKRNLSSRNPNQYHSALGLIAQHPRLWQGKVKAGATDLKTHTHRLGSGSRGSLASANHIGAFLSASETAATTRAQYVGSFPEQGRGFSTSRCSICSLQITHRLCVEVRMHKKRDQSIRCPPTPHFPLPTFSGSHPGKQGT